MGPWPPRPPRPPHPPPLPHLHPGGDQPHLHPGGGLPQQPLPGYRPYSPSRPGRVVRLRPSRWSHSGDPPHPPPSPGHRLEEELGPGSHHLEPLPRLPPPNLAGEHCRGGGGWQGQAKGGRGRQAKGG